MLSSLFDQILQENILLNGSMDYSDTKESISQIKFTATHETLNSKSKINQSQLCFAHSPFGLVM